ncbi:hypothetical protein [Leptospira sp. mild_001]|nr:hypothetical protein [Leptospira sp. mild_001]
MKSTNLLLFQLGEFMANTLSGEKTKYFNTRGEEVFLQPLIRH